MIGKPYVFMLITILQFSRNVSIFLGLSNDNDTTRTTDATEKSLHTHERCQALAI